MRLTWRDGAATVLIAGVVTLYVSFLANAGLPLVSGPRVLGALVLALGVAACAIGGRVAPRAEGERVNPWTDLAGFFGGIAFITAVLVMILGSETLLAVLVGITVALWLAASLRHAFTPGPVPRERPRPTAVREREATHDVYRSSLDR